jgi:DNA (cytosine-5)-methyltransferase 1
MIIAGPPCQPFSKSGYWAKGDSKRLEDPRARTLDAFIDQVEGILPKAFLLENVSGLSFRGKSEGVEYLQRQIQRINKLHGTAYNPCLAILNAANYGVPQFRQRVFFVGSRDAQQFRFPAPTHGDSNDTSLLETVEPYMVTWDAIGDIDGDHEGEDLKLRGKWAALLPSIPEGQNYLFHTDRGDGLPLFGWRRRYWNFLLKLSKSQPSWTIQAQPGPGTGPFHWKNRRLSVRELARLQTIPDYVKFHGGRSSIQRQIGNAVPSLLAEVLASEIKSQLLGRKSSRKLRLLPKRRGKVPPPERVTGVDKQYLSLIGDHVAHPGTGLGNAAKRREKLRTSYLLEEA